MIFYARSFLFAFGVCLPLSLWSTEAQAQASAEEISQLQQLENTYQSELKKIHLPLLNGYISNLKNLAAQSQASEATVFIEQELQTLQQVILAGGVVDLKYSDAILNPAPVPAEVVPKPLPLPSSIRKQGNTLVSLTLDQASQTSTTVNLTSASWTIPRLPKGELEIILQSAVTDFEIPVEIIVELGDQQVSERLQKRHETENTEAVRLIRIGKLTLAQDLVDANLQLSLSPASTTLNLHLRQVILSVKE